MTGALSPPMKMPSSSSNCSVSVLSVTRIRQSMSFALLASIAAKTLLPAATLPRAKKSRSPSLLRLLHTPGPGFCVGPFPQLRFWMQRKPVPHPVAIVAAVEQY
jgi:hypothetical protein